MNLDKFFQSKLFKGLVFGILIFMVALLILKVGMFIGERRANFSYKWSDNYRNNFGGPNGGLMMGFGDRGPMQANGTFGQIIKIDGSTITVKGQDNVEKIILVGDKTIIRSPKETIGVGDLKVDDYIVTIGESNNAGQIEAKFIRVLPEPGAIFNMPMPGFPSR
jgi:hypothetical protein